MTARKKQANKAPGRRGSQASEGAEWDARRAQRLRTAEMLAVGRMPLQVIAMADAAARELGDETAVISLG